MTLPARVPAAAVLGGTFDPVHLGHLAIARHARELLELDRTLLVPTAVPPHKPREALSPARDRLAMVQLAIADEPGLELCTLEMVEDRISYTYETLRRLAAGARPCRPVLLLGMDALCGIDSWYEWRLLLDEFDLATIPRPDEVDGGQAELPPTARARLVPPPAAGSRPGAWRELDPGRGGRIFVLPIAPIPISSSLVRTRAARGEDLSTLVPPAVARYIRNARLYQDQD